MENLTEEDTSIGNRSITTNARLCIELSICGTTFRPVFTHQLFPGEIIRGYKPFSELIPETEATADAPSACVTNGVDEDTYRELSLKVKLAPSCQRCTLEMEIRRPKKRRSRRTLTSVGPSKRARGGDVGNEGIDAVSDGDEKITEEEDSLGDSSYSEEESMSNKEATDLEEHQKEGKTRHRRIPRTEIRERLSVALPDIVEDVHSDFLKEPMGFLLKEYEGGNGDSFCLTIINGRDAAGYHKYVQNLATFFIETASNVDVSDESQGSWRVLYLFRKHFSEQDKVQYSLAGYMTLYHFTAPFRRPKAGTVVRVCQALFLPPYQRAGHGRRMLTTLHEWADGKHNDSMKEQGANDLFPNDIVEINVEDPAPSFTALRNRVDYQRFLLSTRVDTTNWFGAKLTDVDRIQDTGFFSLLADSAAVDAASKGKVTTLQAQIVYEIYKLSQMKRYLSFSSLDADARELLQKQYRIMVKKRLQKQNREELSACGTKQEMQALLGNLFDEALGDYEKILSRTCI